MSPAPPARRGAAFKVVLTLAAPLASLALLELGFRVRAYVENSDTLGAAFSVPPITSARGDVRFRDVIRPCANDRIIFELVPDLDVTFKGAALKTNSHGFRGPARPHEPEPGTATIVGIGGSHMFGHGVSDDQVYLSHLERLLGERHPERKWRAINTSVPSYNAVTAIEVLKEKGLAFQPDLVVLHLDQNSLELPTYVRAEEDPLDLERSFLLDFFRGIRSRRRAAEERFGDLAFADRNALPWHAALATDPDRIPPRFRGLVGWAPFRSAMDELARLAAERGFDVIAFCYLDVAINGGLMRESARRGFHAVSFHDRVYDQLMRIHGDASPERFVASDLVVSPANPHPSAMLHRLTAEWLAAELEACGAIGRTIAER